MELDNKNWSGALSAQQVVDRYGSVQSGNAVFDFGGNDELTLIGISSLSRLVDVIDII